MFDGNVYNTGLTDKLRAITSVYYWTKKNGYDFIIFFNYPFDLQEFLIPNCYKWDENKNSIVYSKKDAVPKALISYNGIFGEKKNVELHKYYLDSLAKEGEKQIHLYTNTYCYDEYFRECFHELFKPSLELKKELDFFSKEIGNSYITISFRFAQLLGDLKDTFGKPLPQNEKTELILKCKEAILPILKKNPNASKVLVTSDSETFLAEVSSLPYVYLLPGKIGHTANNISKDEVKKTFWDMFMISKSLKAYMVRTKQMYKSGFAKRAAMIGNIEFEEVMI